MHQYRLVLKNYPIEGQPKSPLAAYQKENMVKLFVFDVGLLNHILNTGKRTRAKSLQSYITKCAPTKTIKLTGTQGSGPEEQTHLVMPLYYAEYVRERI